MCHYCLSLYRLRNMQGQRQSELTAEVELLPTTDASKTKQTARVPISMNFEVSSLRSCDHHVISLSF